MSVASANVPVTLACGVLCFALGVGSGIGGVAVSGYLKERNPADGGASNSGGAPPPGAAMMGPPGGGIGGPGGGIGGPGGGRGGPTQKAQLSTLITKLDQLTQKPLFVDLTADEKKKVREQLQGLAEKDDLSDEDAKKRLEALLDLLKDKRATMEAAGYRWPGQGGGPGGGGGGFGGGGPGGAGGGRGQAPANPFREGAGQKALKSLESSLAKG